MFSPYVFFRNYVFNSLFVNTLIYIPNHCKCVQISITMCAPDYLPLTFKRFIVKGCSSHTWCLGTSAWMLAQNGVAFTP